MIWSISAWLDASLPTNASAIGPFTAATAFNTPLPKKRICRRHVILMLHENQ